MSIVLAKLFGSVDKLKIIRLFLLNPEEVLLSRDVIRRAKVSSKSARKQINLLSGFDFVHKKKKSIGDGRSKNKKKKVEGWKLNSSFSLLAPLKDLVLDTSPVSRTELLKKLSKIGRIRLVILSGIFIQQENSRVDFLIVGDKVHRNKLEKILKEVEAEIGKELEFAVFSTEDFAYRLNIYDKFIRDILDYPHQKILNKLGV